MARTRETARPSTQHVAKRHVKTRKENTRIPKASLMRLARRAGCMGMRAPCYAILQEVAKNYLTEFGRRACDAARYMGTQTISEKLIRNISKLDGRYLLNDGSFSKAPAHKKTSSKKE